MTWIQYLKLQKREQINDYLRKVSQIFSFRYDFLLDEQGNIPFEWVNLGLVLGGD